MHRRKKVKMRKESPTLMPKHDLCADCGRNFDVNESERGGRHNKVYPEIYRMVDGESVHYSHQCESTELVQMYLGFEYNGCSGVPHSA